MAPYAAMASGCALAWSWCAAAGTTVWSDTFDRELKDALTLQSQVAIQLAKQLKLRLDESAIQGSGTQNPETYQLYLGRSVRWMTMREAPSCCA